MINARLMDEPLMFPPLNRTHDLVDLVKKHGNELSCGRGLTGNVIELGRNFTERDYEATHIETVSRKQVTFVYNPKEDAFYVRDEDSTNGTVLFRDGEPPIFLKSGKLYSLQNRDRLFFGGKLYRLKEKKLDQKEIEGILRSSYGHVIYEEPEVSEQPSN